MSGPVRDRGLAGPVLVVAALTLVVIGAGVHWSGLRDADKGGASGHRRPGAAATGATSTTVTSTGVHYSFDDGLAALAQPAPGTPALTVRSAEGGQITGVPHGDGTALAFPRPCPTYAAPTCPRVVLAVLGDDLLNPGRRSLRWGATIRIAPDQTTPGSNVLQKGYSAGGGQFKLQVDGDVGRPSCVLVDSAKGSTIHIARASIGVADNAWHKVTCGRTGSSLTVAVDGAVVGEATVPAELSVTPDAALCIGGKGTSPNNDQFSGALDDVFVDIEP